DLPADLDRAEAAVRLGLPGPQEVAAPEQLGIGDLAEADIAREDAVEHEEAHEAGLALDARRPRAAREREDADDQPAANLLAQGGREVAGEVGIEIEERSDDDVGSAVSMDDFGRHGLETWAEHGQCGQPSGTPDVVLHRLAARGPSAQGS